MMISRTRGTASTGSAERATTGPRRAPRAPDGPCIAPPAEPPARAEPRPRRPRRERARREPAPARRRGVAALRPAPRQQRAPARRRGAAALLRRLGNRGLRLGGGERLLFGERFLRGGARHGGPRRWAVRPGRAARRQPAAPPGRGSSSAAGASATEDGSSSVGQFVLSGRLCDSERLLFGERLLPPATGSATESGSTAAGGSAHRVRGCFRGRWRRGGWGSDDSLDLVARGDGEVDAAVAEVRRQRCEVDGRLGDGEADVFVARRQDDDARGGSGLGRDAWSISGSCSWSRRPTNGRPARTQGEGVVAHAGGGARWTSMTARPSSTPRT